MVVVCARGELLVLKWLTDISGIEDLRVTTTNGDTLMHIASSFKPLNIAKWLFEAGLADCIHIENRDKETPIMLAFPRDETSDMTLAFWLCELGAAHDNVTNTLDWNRLPRRAHNYVLLNIQHRIGNISAVDILYLETLRTKSSSVQGDTTLARTKVHTRTKLQCFERKLIKMVANFVGAPIPYRQPLRYLRDIQDALLAILEL
jgi:hypothetical protein